MFHMWRLHKYLYLLTYKLLKYNLYIIINTKTKTLDFQIHIVLIWKHNIIVKKAVICTKAVLHVTWNGAYISEIKRKKTNTEDKQQKRQTIFFFITKKCISHEIFGFNLGHKKA